MDIECLDLNKACGQFQFRNKCKSWEQELNPRVPFSHYHIESLSEVPLPSGQVDWHPVEMTAFSPCRQTPGELTQSCIFTCKSQCGKDIKFLLDFKSLSVHLGWPRPAMLGSLLLCAPCLAATDAWITHSLCSPSCCYWCLDHSFSVLPVSLLLNTSPEGGNKAGLHLLETVQDLRWWRIKVGFVGIYWDCCFFFFQCVSNFTVFTCLQVPKGKTERSCFPSDMCIVLDLVVEVNKTLWSSGVVMASAVNKRRHLHTEALSLEPFRYLQ